MQFIFLKQALRDFEQHQRALPDLQHAFGIVRRKSKQVITTLRRDRIAEAQKILKEVERIIMRETRNTPRVVELPAHGFYHEAIEEYIEAKLYYAFVAQEKPSFPRGLAIGFLDMLGGWSDFTGELVRRAITIAHTVEYKDIQKMKTITEQVVELFSLAGFSGRVRAKYDATERNLKRLEEIWYEVQLRT